MIDLTSTNEKVNSGDTNSNTFDAIACSFFSSLAMLKIVYTGVVTSPIKKTKIAEIPPTPRCKEEARYIPARRWCAMKNQSLGSNNKKYKVSARRYANEN